MKYLAVKRQKEEVEVEVAERGEEGWARLGMKEKIIHLWSLPKIWFIWLILDN